MNQQSHRRNKPKTIEVGKNYRLYRWAGVGLGSREPGDQIVHVNRIEGKKQRLVHLTFLVEHPTSWSADYYSALLRKIHSEVPEATT